MVLTRGDVELTVPADDGAVAAVASLRTSAELDQARQEILTTLRDLAEPIAHFNHLAERQRGLTARVRAATGADNGYAAYIDTALFRATDIDSVVEFVIESIKKARVVA
ncbi:MAG: hypothetical protein EPO26_12415 [Chloroflexota bacterium]|nr:MAG: hypothetical protein EPO26_12415 [Chloroflexota bacterium]